MTRILTDDTVKAHIGDLCPRVLVDTSAFGQNRRGRLNPYGSSTDNIYLDRKHSIHPLQDEQLYTESLLQFGPPHTPHTHTQIETVTQKRLHVLRISCSVNRFIEVV